MNKDEVRRLQRGQTIYWRSLPYEVLKHIPGQFITLQRLNPDLPIGFQRSVPIVIQYHKWDEYQDAWFALCALEPGQAEYPYVA